MKIATLFVDKGSCAEISSQRCQLIVPSGKTVYLSMSPGGLDGHSSAEWTSDGQPRLFEDCKGLRIYVLEGTIAVGVLEMES